MSAAVKIIEYVKQKLYISDIKDSVHARGIRSPTVVLFKVVLYI